MLARQIETMCSESKENRTITAYAINVQNLPHISYLRTITAYAIICTNVLSSFMQLTFSMWSNAMPMKRRSDRAVPVTLYKSLLPRALNK
jgi:hypothetical protein